MPHLGTQPPVGFKTTTKQSFSGDNSTTAFTLNRASSTATDLEVFVDNIQQEPTTAYSVSGTTLTFTEAPPTGTNNVYVVNRGGDQNGTLPPQDLGTTDYIFGDDISFNSDSAKLNFGADSEITITHVADTGLNLKHTATGDDKPIILTLQTGETDIAANDVLGTLNFQAPDEGAGTDAILVAAGIEAVSEGDFSSSSNATKLSFKTAASAAAAETMALSSAGNLTVAGTITPTGAITANAGVVVDNITIDGTEIDLSSGDLTVDSAGDITLDSDNGAWRFKDDGTSVFQIARDSNTSVNLFSAISDADLIFKGNDGGSTIEAMRIDMSEGGLVGIGNSSPSSQLAGAANLVIGGTSDADTGMTFVTSTSGQGLIHFSDATSGDARFDGFIGYEQNNQAMKFGTAQTERMRINTTGQVLIGTTSSLYSSTQKDGLQIEGAGGGPFVIVCKNVDTGGGANQILFQDGSGDTCGEIASNATNNTTSYGTSSDYRLKENITDVTNAIYTLKKLKPKTYNFISDPDNIPEDGFLAHELGAVVPNAVTGEKDDMTSDNKIKPQQVDYGRLTPLLTAALQEAIARIDTLEAEVKTLKEG